jgi:hypothetical protein
MNLSCRVTRQAGHFKIEALKGGAIVGIAIITVSS